MNEEILIDDKMRKLIDSKVEYSVTKKFVPINRWLIGSLLSVFMAIIAVIVSITLFMGRIGVFTEMFQKALDKQDLINIGVSAELKEIDVNQMFVIYRLKTNDPTFQVPYQTRGGKGKE